MSKRFWWTAISGLLFASIVGGIWFSLTSALPTTVPIRYVGGAACVECHQQQHAEFVGSHHDLAMDVANPETVLAKFDGRSLSHFGITSTFFTRDEKFFVNTEGPNGAMQDFEVKFVFGCEPLQQYLVEFEPPSDVSGLGRYQVLRLSWNTLEGKWFYLLPPDVNEKIDPSDPLHWTGISQRWNTNCAACHSTNLLKNFDSLTGQYATTFTDIDVNCEACHGPGSHHVQLAQNRWFGWDAKLGTGLVSLKNANAETQVETCAPCHSRRGELCGGFQPGQKFDDHFSCQILSKQIYHDDGQIRDEDYVYGSFIQSKMFHKGIKCTDCHNPHTAKVKFNDNRLCTSCHQHPAGKYDSISHHRHQPGSKGASCVECHMPSTTYMDIDERRDHSIRVPRPDLSVELGTPNACSACHIDKESLPFQEQKKVRQYLDWILESESGNEIVTAELKRVDVQMTNAFRSWWPEFFDRADRTEYYEQLAVGKSDPESNRKLLRKLSNDSKSPGIFRASAIETLSLNDQLFDDPADFETAIDALADDDPKVLVQAATMIGLAMEQGINAANQASTSSATNSVRQRIRKIESALDAALRSEYRAVRIAAARAISRIPKPLLDRQNISFNSTAMQNAFDDWMASLRLTSDTGACHMILAGIYESRSEFEKAENAYRTAISVEPNFSGPRSNLAAVLDRRIEDLRDRILRTPGSQGNVGLGKRIDRLLDEAQTLRKEENKILSEEVNRVENLDDAHGLFYRYGLSCYLMRDFDSAEKYLQRAANIENRNATYLLALATFYLEQNKLEDAILLTDRLLEIEPENPSYQSLRRQILKGN